MVAEPTEKNDDPFDGINEAIHTLARLKLMTQLYVVEAADATFLMNSTGLTWGNLSTHLKRLKDCGYIDVEKGFAGTKPRTMIGLTDKGRDSFRQYRGSMQRILGGLPD